MNENSTNTELLIQFLDGELPAEQLDSFNQTLEQIPALREELENLRMARETIKTYGLKNRIGSIHTEMMEELKSGSSQQTGMVRKIYSYSLRIAAVILVLFGLSIFYQYASSTPEKLFMENFQAFDLHETRGASASPISDLYKAGNMESVIQLFSNLKNPEALDYFLAGNAFLSQYQPGKAIETFLTLEQINLSTRSHSFEEDAEYYLALSYLDNKEPGKALPILEKIHNDANHTYHKKVSAWFLLKVRKTSKG
jgi:tetratricopeptide (TPR) repeat protein